MYLNILPFKNYARALHTVKVAHFPLLTSLQPPSFCRWMLEHKTSILTCSIFRTFHVMLKYEEQQEGTWATWAGLAGLSPPSALVLSVDQLQYTKIGIAFLRRNPTNLIQEGVTQESYGLKHFREEAASFELSFPTSQPHAPITVITGGCEKTAESSAGDPAPARLWFHGSKHPGETGTETPYVTRNQQYVL